MKLVNNLIAIVIRRVTKEGLGRPRRLSARARVARQSSSTLTSSGVVSSLSSNDQSSR